WRPAEAYHFYILAQRQFKANNPEAALRSALTLTEYEDILPVQTIYNLIALCATSCGAFNTASKAFLKLEDDPSINEEDRKEYQKLAFQIFLRTHYNHIFNWNLYKNDQEEYCIPIIESSPILDRPYCFDKKKRLSKNQIMIEESPIKDYFKASLCACLSFFWMFAGIVCLIQSIKIRHLLKRNNSQFNDEARQLSNRLYTNLVLTYVFGIVIIGVLIMTVLVTFIVGIKGYFSKSL
ncbi:unnamed protein product, partial [Rotaria sp. Silwood1]